MRKRVLFVIIMVLLCFCSVFMLSACGETKNTNGEVESTNGEVESTNDESKHTHVYTEIVTVPTCSGQGFTTHICSCGASYKDNYVDNITATKIFEKSKNSVGEIITFDKSGSELSLGTGFVYSTDGKIITNYHVIDEAYSAKITINGVSYTVQSVLAYNKNIDLAVLKINATGLPVLNICKKSHSVGMAVYAFGSSKGLTATFSQGIITYADRELDGVHYVQHDAAISSGNSGGPLINQYDEVIGINTMAIKDSQNLNFAISVNELSKLTYNTPLTVKEFYEKECDVFAKVKNHVMKKGTYDYEDNDYSLTLGVDYSSDYSSQYTRIISYDVADDELCLMLFIDADHLLSIYIDEVDYIYEWGYINSDDYYMSGTLYATTFTSNHLLGYSYNNISSSSLRSSVRELASSMASLLITYTNMDFADIGVRAIDLGFINY